MGYIKSWTDFETAATQLYTSSPNRVRYCVKFRPNKGHLVLRLTDDTTCLMYKTFSAIILNRFEALNSRLLSQIANVKPKPRELLVVPAADEGRAGTPGLEAGGDGDDPMTGTTAAATSTPVELKKAGGGGKKKKKGKK